MTVVGDLKSSMIPESQLAQVVRLYLDKAFNEVATYLKTMK